MSRLVRPIVGAQYDLGNGDTVLVPNGNAISSTVFNTRDLGSEGNPSFPFFPPGSQASLIGYSMLLEAAAPAPDPQLSTLELNVSFDLAPVFIFARAQRVSLLPLNTNVGALYEGSFRVEGPAASLNYINTSGVDITVSFQFWGKVL